MSVGRWLVFDAIALGAYAFAANPAVTGIPVHEIVGAAVLVVFLVHCAQHVEVVAETIKGALSSRRAFRAANVALDALIVIALMVCIVSGLLISGTVLPMAGLYADGYFFGGPLHAASAKLLLALLLIHVAAHFRMVIRLVRSKTGVNLNREEGVACREE